MDKKHLVLLVDDEPDILDMYSDTLREAGFDVITAVDGVQAVTISKEKMPDLILMDMKMPNMNGIDAFMRIKEDPATANIRIAFLTAFSDIGRTDIDEKAAKEMGAIDYIKKGISLDEFVTRVKGYFK